MKSSVCWRIIESMFWSQSMASICSMDHSFYSIHTYNRCKRFSNTIVQIYALHGYLMTLWIHLQSTYKMGLFIAYKTYYVIVHNSTIPWENVSFHEKLTLPQPRYDFKRIKVNRYHKNAILQKKRRVIVSKLNCGKW